MFKYRKSSREFKLDPYSSSSSGIDLFINKKTGILISFEDDFPYYQGIVYKDSPYTEEELKEIKDWVSSKGIGIGSYKMYSPTRIQPVYDGSDERDHSDEEEF